MPRKTADEKPLPLKTKKPLLLRLNEALGIIFYVIWILIGIFFILFIIANFRQGTFRGLFSTPTTEQQQPVQAPTETTIPGIGKVNIACVQNALSSEAIQKILKEGNTSTLTEEEKTAFEPCIVEKETPSSPSPTPGK